jgi:gamma-glutamyltranspeptidase
LILNAFKANNIQKLDTGLLDRNDYMKQMFTRNDILVQENDTIKNPMLAKTLLLLIDDNNNLYNGRNLSLGFLQSTKGQISITDLRSYNEIENQLVISNYQGNHFFKWIIFRLLFGQLSILKISSY